MLNMRNCEEMRSENYAEKEKVLRREAKKLIIGKRFILMWRGFSFILFFIFCQKLINGSRLNSHFTALLFFIVISFRFFIFSFQWKIHQTFFYVVVRSHDLVFFFLSFCSLPSTMSHITGDMSLTQCFPRNFSHPSQLFPFHSLFISSWNIHNFYLDSVFAISWETFFFLLVWKEIKKIGAIRCDSFLITKLNLIHYFESTSLRIE